MIVSVACRLLQYPEQSRRFRRFLMPHTTVTWVDRGWEFDGLRRCLPPSFRSTLPPKPAVDGWVESTESRRRRRHLDGVDIKRTSQWMGCSICIITCMTILRSRPRAAGGEAGRGGGGRRKPAAASDRALPALDRPSTQRAAAVAPSHTGAWDRLRCLCVPLELRWMNDLSSGGRAPANRSINHPPLLLTQQPGFHSGPQSGRCDSVWRLHVGWWLQ